MTQSKQCHDTIQTTPRHNPNDATQKQCDCRSVCKKPVEWYCRRTIHTLISCFCHPLVSWLCKELMKRFFVATYYDVPAVEEPVCLSPKWTSWIVLYPSHDVGQYGPSRYWCQKAVLTGPLTIHIVVCLLHAYYLFRIFLLFTCECYICTYRYHNVVFVYIEVTGHEL